MLEAYYFTLSYSVQLWSPKEVDQTQHKASNQTSSRSSRGSDADLLEVWLKVKATGQRHIEHKFWDCFSGIIWKKQKKRTQ